VLTLRSSPTSPFVRKVRIAASVLGLDREIMLEPADTMSPSDSVRQQNPLGKIPALMLEDGTVLFDSRVILDYLDHRAGGGRIIPTDASARFAALRL
jgi:glutathione S-transferase